MTTPKQPKLTKFGLFLLEKDFIHQRPPLRGARIIYYIIGGLWWNWTQFITWHRV